MRWRCPICLIGEADDPGNPGSAVQLYDSPPEWGGNVRVLLVVNGSVERDGSAAGGNPHALVADHRTCRWTTTIRDTTRLAIGMLEASEFAYLIHPEHGASANAPGRYVIRRQREYGRAQHYLVAD